MHIFTTVFQIQNYLSSLPTEKSIGFVPTMGALHDGHLSLIRQAKSQNDLCISSIFVNPIQFNNQKDLEKYPRTYDEDVEMLKGAFCDVLFYPEVKEMYPVPDTTKYDFNHLDRVMEGEFRPGHFRGVAVVVRRLFEIIKPHRAYFGKKDFQQLKIVESLVKQFSLSPEIVGCEIIREKDGLAMSSRNMRLNDHQRLAAPLIYEALLKAKQIAKQYTVSETIRYVMDTINSNKELHVEYFKICDSQSLLEIESWETSKTPMGFIVVNVGEIRLIDNINFIL